MLQNRVGLDVIVGKPAMDEGVVLIVVETVADRLENPKEMGKKTGLFKFTDLTGKIEQFKGSRQLQYTYPEAGHRGAVVLVQQIPQVLDLTLINTQLLNHVIWSE